MESGSDVLERTLQERIKQAIDLNTVLVDEFELDEIRYIVKGWPQVHPDGSYGVLWTRYTGTSSHSGQQNFIGYRDEYDFADHEDCGLCNPVNESSYWKSIQNVWVREKLKFKVSQWTPEDDSWC